MSDKKPVEDETQCQESLFAAIAVIDIDKSRKLLLDLPDEVYDDVTKSFAQIVFDPGVVSLSPICDKSKEEGDALIFYFRMPTNAVTCCERVLQLWGKTFEKLRRRHNSLKDKSATAKAAVGFGYTRKHENRQDCSYRGKAIIRTFSIAEIGGADITATEFIKDETTGDFAWEELEVDYLKGESERRILWELQGLCQDDLPDDLDPILSPKEAFDLAKSQIGTTSNGSPQQINLYQLAIETGYVEPEAYYHYGVALTEANKSERAIGASKTQSPKSPTGHRLITGKGFPSTN